MHNHPDWSTNPLILGTMWSQEITPDQARQIVQASDLVIAEGVLLFGRPFRNRPLTKNRALGFANEMSNGEWHDTGDPIHLTPDGILFNGQHRLFAIAESGTTQVITIAIRPLEMFTDLDKGHERSHSDTLACLHYSNYKNMAGTGRIILSYNLDKRFGQTHPSRHDRIHTNSHIEQWAKAHPESPDFVSRVQQWVKESQLGGKVALLSAAWMLCQSKDKTLADWFYPKVCKNDNLEYRSPEWLLWNRLREQSYHVKKVHSAAYGVFIVKAWNARRTGAKISILKPLVEGEKWPDFV